jgi:hypothetical protein
MVGAAGRILTTLTGGSDFLFFFMDGTFKYEQGHDAQAPVPFRAMIWKIRERTFSRSSKGCNAFSVENTPNLPDPPHRSTPLSVESLVDVHVARAELGVVLLDYLDAIAKPESNLVNGRVRARTRGGAPFCFTNW